MIPAVLASVLGVIVLVSVFGLWTSRRRLASELQEAVRIVELANDPILVADMVRGQVVHANQAACRLLGYRAEQLLTKALPDLHPQRSIARSAEIIADVWEKKGLVYSEIPFMRADGSEIPVEVSANVFQFRGRPAILLFARDQRERLRLEQQLVQSEKMASLGQLVAGVAHEINTPMGSIHSNIGTAQSAIELLERALARDDIAPILATDHKLKRALAILKESCEVNRLASERIVGIVGSLRNFARLDEADRKTVDLHEGIESTLTLLRHQIKHGIEVVREYGPEMRVDCYPNQLNQVFMNVLLNAVQSMDGKGTITISSERREHEVAIRIGDTGKGIPPEHLPRVFDPGFTTKGVGVGTGLGLSIAYQIMQKHAGSIECQSQLGVGTTFTLRLPISRNAASPRKG
jgi:two-component system NtrC family sensor kinase